MDISMADLKPIYRIHARRRSDFAVINEDHDSEHEAHQAAKRLFANRYDVTVKLIAEETLAEWKHPK